MYLYIYIYYENCIPRCLSLKKLLQSKTAWKTDDQSMSNSCGERTLFISTKTALLQPVIHIFCSKNIDPLVKRITLSCF